MVCRNGGISRRVSRRASRIRTDIDAEIDATRARLEALETARRALRRAISYDARVGGRGGASRHEYEADQDVLGAQIASALAEGPRTVDAVTAALVEDGIAVERADIGALLCLDVARPDGRFEPVGDKYRLRGEAVTEAQVLERMGSSR
jgi:hypothetical protein